MIPELERRGHRVVAVDVRFDDPTATFEDHAATFAAALDEGDDDVVAVGHSLGSYAFPGLRAVGRYATRCTCAVWSPSPGAHLSS